MDRIVCGFLAILLLTSFGCLETSSYQPSPDITNASSTGFSKYNGFVSFEFPSNMSISHKLEEYAGGTGTASVSGQGNDSSNKTIFTLIFLNTTASGSDSTYRADPQKTVHSFLSSDSLSDPAMMLSNAKDKSEIADIAGSGNVPDGAYVSEIVFSVKLLGSDGSPVKYSGYAINLYYPERSALYRFRVISMDGGKATEIKDKFIGSFEG